MCAPEHVAVPGHGHTWLCPDTDTLPRILEYAQNTHRIRTEYAWTIVPAYSMHILCVFYEYSVSILCTYTH